MFEDMFQAGMQPTVVTWNTLLASFAPSGDWVNALDVLTKACFEASLEFQNSGASYRHHDWNPAFEVSSYRGGH